jgi:hypothetical protein
MAETVECLHCKAVVPVIGAYRCWDCKAWLCERCCGVHMGNQHQPHPMHLHEYKSLVTDMRDALDMVRLHFWDGDGRTTWTEGQVATFVEQVLADPSLFCVLADVFPRRPQVTEATEAYQSRTADAFYGQLGRVHARVSATHPAPCGEEE